jgi:uncharacterized protein
MSGSSVRPRSVVDTNLFVSGAISPRGAPRRLLEALYDQRFHLLLSKEQYGELSEVFRRPRLRKLFRYSRDELAALFALVAAAPPVTPVIAIPVQVRDPKDIKILAAALGGDADYLVTGDGDLLEHRDDPRLGKLQIVTAAEFLNILDALAAEGKS